MLFIDGRLNPRKGVYFSVTLQYVVCVIKLRLNSKYWKFTENTELMVVVSIRQYGISDATVISNTHLLTIITH